MSSHRKNGDKRESDFYPTPSWCVDLIMREIAWSPAQCWLEPCKGDGVIYDRIPCRKEWCEIREGRDYLTCKVDARFDGVITNLPFSLAERFIRHSLSHADCVVYLLRLNFLGSRKRNSLFREHPPSHLFVHSERPDFTGEGGDSTEYAWFCWGKSKIIRKPGVYVISTTDLQADLFAEDTSGLYELSGLKEVME